MKALLTAVGAALLACNLSCFAQTATGCGQTLDAPLRSKAVLKIDSLSAGLEVVGTDREVAHVSCNGDNVDSLRNIRLRLSGTPENLSLSISGSFPHHGNLEIRVEVPRKTSLKIEMPAGQVNIEEIAGDKDIDLYAGQITISSTHGWNYKNVDASVRVGQVSAPAYGVDKGGFFRRFHKESADGEYQLHAHILSGRIVLSGPNVRLAAE